jgi:hypothetical protein
MTAFYAVLQDGEYIDVSTEANVAASARWIGPKDLPRVAGMLRQAAELIEAIIEANREKEKRPIQSHLRILPDQIARAA